MLLVMETIFETESHTLSNVTFAVKIIALESVDLA